MHRSIALLILGTGTLVPSAKAQSATVTFFAAKAPDKAGRPLGGELFEGEKDLQSIGELGTGRFVTLQLPVGKHHFAAIYNKQHKGGEGDLDITLEPGDQYFVRVSVNIKSAFVVYGLDESLTAVDCKTARDEASADKPVDAKHVDPAYRDALQGGSYFPHCAEER
jgi:hypothetical protein